MVSITYGQCYSEKSADNPRFEDGEHYLRTVLQWEERRQSMIWGWWALPTDSVTVRRSMIWGWWALPTERVTVRRAQTIHDMRMVSITYGQSYGEKSADNPRYEDGEHHLRTVLQWEERRQSTIWGWWALPTDSVTVRRAQTIHDMRMVSSVTVRRANPDMRMVTITYGESNSEKSADNPWYEDGEHYLRTVLQWEERRQSTIWGWWALPTDSEWEERRQSMIWGWWALPTDSVTVRRAQTIHDMRMVSITYGQCYSEKNADNPRYEEGEHHLRTVLQWEERRQSTIWGWWASPTDSVTVRRAQTIHDMRMVTITYGESNSEKSADNQRYEDGEHHLRTVLQWEERR